MSRITSALGRAAIRTTSRASVPAARAAAPRLMASALRANESISNTLNTRTTRATFVTSCRLFAPISAEKLKTATPAPLSDEEYHSVADEHLELILTRYEEMAETREDVDVEYSVSYVQGPAPPRNIRASSVRTIYDNCS